MDYDRKTVYRRLNSLAEEGEIQRLEVGEGRGKSVGWYVQDASESLSDADQIAQAVVEHLDGASLRLDASERKRLAEDVAEELRQ